MNCHFNWHVGAIWKHNPLSHTSYAVCCVLCLYIWIRMNEWVRLFDILLSNVSILWLYVFPFLFCFSLSEKEWYLWLPRESRLIMRRLVFYFELKNFVHFSLLSFLHSFSNHGYTYTHLQTNKLRHLFHNTIYIFLFFFFFLHFLFTFSFLKKCQIKIA